MTRELRLDEKRRHFVAGSLVRLVDKTDCRPSVQAIPLGAVAMVRATNDRDPSRVAVKFFEPLGVEALTWACRFELVAPEQSEDIISEPTNDQ